MKIRTFITLLFVALTAQTGFAELSAKQHSEAAKKALLGHLKAGKYRIGAKAALPDGEPFEMETAKVEGWSQFRTSGKIAVYYQKDQVFARERAGAKFEVITEEKDGAAKTVSIRVLSD